MKFYVKPKKPESEDELEHSGRRGQKWGEHKFGRWQSQAGYANGQPDPNANRPSSRKVNVTGIGKGAHRRDADVGGGGGGLNEDEDVETKLDNMVGDPDEIAYDELGKPIHMTLEREAMKDPAKRRRKMQQLIGFVDVEPMNRKMSRKELQNLACLAGIMKYGNADELRDIYNKDTARLKRGKAERDKAGKMEK